MIQTIALFFKIGHSIGSRLVTPASQSQVLHINPKKANQYVLNVKHELTFVQGETYTSLLNHAQAWLHLILCTIRPIFSKKLGGKQGGKPSNISIDSNCQEAR